MKANLASQQLHCITTMRGNINLWKTATTQIVDKQYLPQKNTDNIYT